MRSLEKTSVHIMMEAGNDVSEDIYYNNIVYYKSCMFVMKCISLTCFAVSAVMMCTDRLCDDAFVMRFFT